MATPATAMIGRGRFTTAAWYRAETGRAYPNGWTLARGMRLIVFQLNHRKTALALSKMQIIKNSFLSRVRTVFCSDYSDGITVVALYVRGRDSMRGRITGSAKVKRGQSSQ